MKKIISSCKKSLQVQIVRPSRGVPIVQDSLLIGFGVVPDGLKPLLVVIRNILSEQKWVNFSKTRITIAAHKTLKKPGKQVITGEFQHPYTECEIVLIPEKLAISGNNALVLVWKEDGDALAQMRKAVGFMNTIPKNIHTTLMKCKNGLAFEAYRPNLEEMITTINEAMGEFDPCVFDKVRFLTEVKR